MTASRAATVGPGEYTDPSVKGLQLRVRNSTAGLTRTWLFRYKWRGQGVRLALGSLPATTYAMAKHSLLQFRSLLDQGIDPRGSARRYARRTPGAAEKVGEQRNAPHSIEALVHEFMERHIKPRRKRPEYAQKMLERDVLPVWRGRDARTITPAEVISLLDGIVDRGSPVAANRVAGMLSQLFRFGVHRAIITSTPVQLLYRPGGTERPRSRVLSEDELRALLRNPDERPRFVRLTRAIRILLLTGQRRGELALARWREIDFEERTWRIPDEVSKTGRGHVVPLSEAAVNEFRALKSMSGRSPFVFPAVGASEAADPKLLTRNLARAKERFKELKVAPFTLHDLRRTCRTGLARLKVEPHIAERVLNHAQERIPGTYDVHDYLEEKRAALDRWAAHLATLQQSMNLPPGFRPAVSGVSSSATYLDVGT